MAIDVYLQVDGIKGESTDSTHQGWIEVSQAQWGVTQPISAQGSGTGGRTTGRSEYRSLSLAKLADLASPVLLQHCSNGKIIPKAKLEFMRADGDGNRVKYYEVELENVLIANMEQMVAEGSIMRDHIALHFSKVKWKYSQQKIGGGMGGHTTVAGICPVISLAPNWVADHGESNRRSEAPDSRCAWLLYAPAYATRVRLLHLWQVGRGAR